MAVKVFGGIEVEVWTALMLLFVSAFQMPALGLLASMCAVTSMPPVAVRSTL